MLCSDCSYKVKPVVAIDIDGTMGGFHEHFLTFAETYLGVHAGRWDYDGERGFRDWFCETYDVDTRTWNDIKLAYRQGAMKRSMRAYAGARELCQGVKDAGAELWLTTTRPHLRLDNVDPDTRAWLERNDISYDYMLYDEAKYSLLALRVDPTRVVAVLDDLGEQYDEAVAVFGFNVALLRGTKWNRALEVPTDKRVLNLFEARTRIWHMIKEWTEQHE